MGLGVCTSHGSSLTQPGQRGWGQDRGTRTRTACHPRSASAPSSDQPDERGSAARSQQNLRRPGPLDARVIHRSQGESEHLSIPQKNWRLNLKRRDSSGGRNTGRLTVKSSPGSGLLPWVSWEERAGAPKIVCALDEPLTQARVVRVSA